MYMQPESIEMDPRNEIRWEKVVQRDRTADGTFFFGVVTTGIYCRPACASRRPKRENVRFFDTWEQAEQAGLRPCKRCQPKAEQDPYQEVILQACEALDRAEVPPTLAALARTAGLSPYHFQRLFKRAVGISPKQYFLEKRSERVRAQLQESETVTEAIYAAGFSSSGRFYSQAAAALGMKPAEYQKGGSGKQIQFAAAQSYLGWVIIAATPEGICAIDFGDDPQTLIENLMGRFPGAQLSEGDQAFSDRVAAVIAFLESPQRGLGLPLDVQGTAFQRRVWLALQEIPAGTTLSYAEVARRIGSPKATRAVAQACAANKIAVAIPCHRVVRSNGALGGYRWGLERKQKLLEREESGG